MFLTFVFDFDYLDILFEMTSGNNLTKILIFYS